MAKFVDVPKIRDIMEPAEPPIWNLFMDGLSGKAGRGVDMVLVSPDGYKLNCMVRLGFKGTKNIVEYEVLLAYLRLAKEMQMKKLIINSDFQLLVTQVNDSFSAKD